MNKFQRSLATAIAAGALLVNTVLPVFAETTIIISGNGTDSENGVEASFSQSTTVVQSNDAKVENKVNATASTGANEAKDNTGGDVSIDTGDADVTVDVANTLNKNAAEVDCCPGGDVEVEISGNGSDTKNGVELGMESVVELYQNNEADVDNDVEAFAGTGKNEAKDNTGGSVSIDTGEASVTVNLSTGANWNSAKVGGGSGSGLGSLSALILGNGTDSENSILLGLGSGVLIAQANEADVDNDVEAFAGTGANEAKDNTGGESSIDTGDATVDVTVDNMVNFNWADSDCGCLLEDLLLKIAGNGEDSKNEIKLGESGSLLEVFQGNCEELSGEVSSQHRRHGNDCEVENEVWADAKTGKNEVGDNTGDPGGDPSVDTGNAETTVDLETSGYSNVYGSTPDWEFPDLSGFSFHFSFDLSDLLDWLSSQS